MSPFSAASCSVAGRLARRIRGRQSIAIRLYAWRCGRELASVPVSCDSPAARVGDRAPIAARPTASVATAHTAINSIHAAGRRFLAAFCILVASCLPITTSAAEKRSPRDALTERQQQTYDRMMVSYEARREAMIEQLTRAAAGLARAKPTDAAGRKRIADQRRKTGLALRGWKERSEPHVPTAVLVQGSVGRLLEPRCRVIQVLDDGRVLISAEPAGRTFILSDWTREVATGDELDLALTVVEVGPTETYVPVSGGTRTVWTLALVDDAVVQAFKDSFPLRVRVP